MTTRKKRPGERDGVDYFLVVMETEYFKSVLRLNSFLLTVPLPTPDGPDSTNKIPSLLANDFPPKKHIQQIVYAPLFVGKFIMANDALSDGFWLHSRQHDMITIRNDYRTRASTIRGIN